MFDLANYGGGCAVIGQGTFASMVAAGVPNDFVGSLKVGSAALVKISKDTSQGGLVVHLQPGPAGCDDLLRRQTGVVDHGVVVAAHHVCDPDADAVRFPGRPRRRSREA